MLVELEIDGELAVRIEAPPSGLWGDGPASVYERIEVRPGEHALTARLRDSNREKGWDYSATRSMTLEPGRNYTITFHAATGGFAFR